MVQFEHTLFQLLLLVSLLNSKPPKHEYSPYIITLGILLAFVPPAKPLPIPWDLVLGLSLPLLLWQNARRIAKARWLGEWKAILLWLGSAILIGAMLILTNALGLTGAILFGLITASMIWRSGETDETSNFISQIGPLTLVFLLMEVESLIEMPTRYLGGIFSGIAIGVVVALVAVNLTLKAKPQHRNWIAIGQIYFAFGFASIMGVSVIAASFASVVVFVLRGLYRGFWPQNQIQPIPLNNWPGFIAFLALFLFLGWQAHQPFSMLLLVEVVVGCMLGLFIAWIGRRLALPEFLQRGSIFRTSYRIALLLFLALLLWPRGINQEPILLAYAFGLAAMVFVLSRMLSDYFS